MVIGRKLRVRGKLNLLLLLPLAAVVLVAVPFVIGQVDNARSSTSTADAARNARQLGALIWELQQERLVTADYLAEPTADDSAMVLQQQIVADDAEKLQKSVDFSASDELSSALVRLGSLAELRQNSRHRGAALDSVARAYHAVIEALIDALRLVSERTSDAEGTRQLTALDALLRANEESALRGMALIAAAVRPQVGQDLLTTSSAQSQMFTERFVQQANADQAALVVLVDQGEAAHRVDALAQNLPSSGDQNAVQPFVRGSRAAAEAQANLRRLVQDQVTSQIADAAGKRANTARITAWTVGLGAAILLALVLTLAFVVSRSIAQPLQRLTRAATTVADLANTELVRVADVEQVDEQPPRLAAINVSSSDEVGDLAVAFNRVQTTAALLLERQAVTRRNVSLMFANVAQRTQNLVGRQLALVDDLERDEQNTRLLTSLYRLDHLSTRLRRNAENLLVIAGSNDQARTAASTPLTTVLRSALAEIEDYQRVNIGTMQEVTIVAPLVSDLVLVFAELLENATAFSPPQSKVDVYSARTSNDWCQISIMDHGIGMSPQKVAEENRRMVERERLDIVPTSVLGLFVVGRLARRHGLAVNLAATPGGGITARVAIPPNLFVQEKTSGTTQRPAIGSGGGLGQRLEESTSPVTIPPIPKVPGRFSWFTARTGERRAIKADVTIEPQDMAEDAPDVTVDAVPQAIDAPPTPESAPAPVVTPEPGATTAPAPSATTAPAPSATTAPAPSATTAPAPSATTAPATPVPPPAADTAPADRVTPRFDSAPPGRVTPRFDTVPAARAVPPANLDADRRSGLQRRVRGAQLPTATFQGADPTPATRPPHDPDAARSAMDAFQTAVARAGWTSAPPSPESGTGPGLLSRRTPGASLAPGLREGPTAAKRRGTAATHRDPEAERAAFDGFASGLAEAQRQAGLGPNSHDETPGTTKEGTR
jgi:signal transduction histidine kinase